MNWASGLDERGRPIQTPQPPGSPTWPGNQGGTNWYSPSYSPRTGLFYFSAWENYASIYRKETSVYQPGRNFSGGGFTRAHAGARRARRSASGAAARSTTGPTKSATAPSSRSIRAPGEQKWKFDQFDVTDSGILTTASDLLFTGGREGYFYALDARTGTLLWKASLGGQIVTAPITYEVDGKQYVSVIAGHTLVTFALRDVAVEQVVDGLLAPSTRPAVEAPVGPALGEDRQESLVDAHPRPDEFAGAVPSNEVVPTGAFGPCAQTSAGRWDDRRRSRPPARGPPGAAAVRALRT